MSILKKTIQAVSFICKRSCKRVLHLPAMLFSVLVLFWSAISGPFSGRWKCWTWKWLTWRTMQGMKLHRTWKCRKLQDIKMTDVKMQDMKLQDMKMQEW